MNEVIFTLVDNIAHHKPLTFGEWLLIIGFVGILICLGYLLFKAANYKPK